MPKPVNASCMTNAAPVEFGFCVADLARSVQFYEEVIGLETVSALETDARSAVESGFACDSYRVVRLQFPTGERLKLFAPHHPPHRAPDRVSPIPLAQVGFAFLTLIVADLSAVLRRVEEAGYLARSPKNYELRAGVYVALVEDPDGNLLEFVQYSDLPGYRGDLPFDRGLS